MQTEPSNWIFFVSLHLGLDDYEQVFLLSSLEIFNPTFKKTSRKVFNLVKHQPLAKTVENWKIISVLYLEVKKSQYMLQNEMFQLHFIKWQKERKWWRLFINKKNTITFTLVQTILKKVPVI